MVDDRVAAFTDPIIESINHRIKSLEKLNADQLMSLPFYPCLLCEGPSLKVSLLWCYFIVKKLIFGLAMKHRFNQCCVKKMTFFLVIFNQF